ncbi:MAG TPA: hypothetical protein VM687_06650 [Stenotrophomonas sp.]|nr:hypothetical protein [Stenotrophomonas sp.]
MGSKLAYPALVALVVLSLAGCASDGVDNVAGGTGNRPECLVGDDPITTSRDSGMSARDRDCGTDRNLRWSTEDRAKDDMKVDFGKRDR